MPTEIIELDKVVSPDKKVRINGTVYNIPASPPMEYFLWMRQFLDRVADGITNGDVEDLYQHTILLFQRSNPDVVSLPLTMEQCITFFTNVYGQPDGEQDPPPRTRGGTGSRAPRTKSRS